MKARTLKEQLEMDAALYGQSFVVKLPPTLISRAWAFIWGKTAPDRFKRLDPRQVRHGQSNPIKS